MHHINQCLSVFDGTVIDLIFNQLGYLSVAMFLFFSGYGLTAQAKRRENYVKDMWETRILPTYVIFAAISRLFKGAKLKNKCLESHKQ